MSRKGNLLNTARFQSGPDHTSRPGERRFALATEEMSIICKKEAAGGVNHRGTWCGRLCSMALRSAEVSLRPFFGQAAQGLDAALERLVWDRV